MGGWEQITPEVKGRMQNTFYQAERSTSSLVAKRRTDRNRTKVEGFNAVVSCLR